MTGPISRRSRLSGSPGKRGKRHADMGIKTKDKITEREKGISQRKRKRVKRCTAESDASVLKSNKLRLSQ